MLRFFIIIQLFNWMPTPSFDTLLEKSKIEINKRYYSAEPHKLLDTFNYVSETGAVRERFFKLILNSSKITKPILIVEYSSSGETFSYNGVVIGYNKNNKLCKMTYSFYSNTEKIKLKEINVEDFNKQMRDFKSAEYDDQVKPVFPSSLIILSFATDTSEWTFRLSEFPTTSISKIISM